MWDIKWADRYHRGDHRRQVDSGQQHDAGVLYHPSVFCTDAGSWLRLRGHGGVIPADASPDGGDPVRDRYFHESGRGPHWPNEHKDFEDYKRCKGILFTQCRLGIANVDDQWFEDVFRNATCKVETYGSRRRLTLGPPMYSTLPHRGIWA